MFGVNEYFRYSPSDIVLMELYLIKEWATVRASYEVEF